MIDWPRIILDLERLGLSVSEISIAINVPRSTVDHWKNKGTSPIYERGERLINYWSSLTQKSRDQQPIKCPNFSTPCVL